MIPWSGQIVINAISPTTAPARRILRAYMDDVVSRYHGRKATEDEIDAGIHEAPSDDLTGPDGIFLVAQYDGTAVGCVGLRFVSDRIGEVKRLFVVAAARRCGLGSRLMHELEALASERGLDTFRLDTRDDLVEARHLYARLGYRAVDAFNDGPYAEHWLQKDLRK